MVEKRAGDRLREVGAPCMGAPKKRGTDLGFVVWEVYEVSVVIYVYRVLRTSNRATEALESGE